ncbi:MAG: ribonuclease J [Acholeplasma sp.]|nr:ribonuclease J [Acholeplasma sp.]
MSQIKIFALGGLGENGKNMYCVEVDSQIFVLDAGIKYPTSELFGVDEIVPDYKYLIEQLPKVKGFFMTHAHEDHIGALPHILREINVPVYATHFTMELIKDNLKEEGFDLDKMKLHVVNQNSIIKFNNVKVNFFTTTHSIPESIGIAINTQDGSIIYTSDFTFDQSADPRYQTDFRKINEISEKKVLCLMTESLGSGLVLNGSINKALDYDLNEAISNAKGRVVASLFSSDLLKIQRVIDIALKHKKRIAIIGRRAQRIVDIAIDMNYLNIPKESLISLRYIDEKNKNDDSDIVALVTGNRHEPFYMLQRMCKKADRLIHIDDKDTVIVVASPIPGTEKMAAKTLDILYRTDAKIHVIDKKLLTASHATADEIKMMMNMLKPEFIVPVIGEYRMQYAVMKLAKDMGYSQENVFLMDNGDGLFFTDGKPVLHKSKIRSGDILIDGSAVGDVNDIVIHDRELLSEDGVLLIIANINPRSKRILGEIEIVTKGFVYVKESEQLLKDVKEVFLKAADKHLKGKYINWNELKTSVREDINKFLYKETRRSPITIPVIIATEV